MFCPSGQTVKQIDMIMKKNLVFLTGAGMSVESGFSTFRGNNGLWDNYPVEKVCSHEGWLADPELVTNFYNNLRRKLWKGQPNDGHRLIKKLEEEYRVTVVTQNVDNLHEKAGSSNVIHLHGELTKVCSSDDPYNPKYIEELTTDHSDVKPGTKAKDGSLLRPFIVFFGESVPMIEPAAQAVMKADIFVVVGTSLNVYPAAGLLQYAGAGVPVYLIDPHPPVSSANRKVTVIAKGAVEGMKELYQILTRDGLKG